MSREGGVPQSILNKSRADKFTMVITLPPVLRSLNAQILSQRNQDTIQQDTLQFSVWGILVPGVSIPAQDLPTWGQPYKVTSQAREAYSPISVNFTIDNRFNNYWVLWKWLEYINRPKESGMDDYFNDEDVLKNRGQLDNKKFVDYQTIITVFGLDEYNQKVVKFDYSNAFITNLGEIRYNYRDPTELETSFEFAFNQMVVTLLNPTLGTPLELSNENSQ